MAFIRLRTYSAISIFLTTFLVAYSSNQYQQFYPIVVHLVGSKISRLILLNDAVLSIVILGRLVQMIFLGKLRTAEEETAWEKSYVALIETCLALTIFRDELSSRVFVTFVFCLFIKIFHWLSQLRVKYIESLPDTPRSTFVRLYMLLSILLAIDLGLSKYFLSDLLSSGPTVKVLFLTEYSIMAVISLTSLIRLTMHAVNSYMQNRQLAGDARDDDGPGPVGWEGHERAIFYLDIASDLLQSFIYILFFGVIMSKYGLPIHLLRDIYVAVHSVFKRVNDLLQYRRLTTNLDQRFPEANANDLLDSQICVVCRNEMVFGQSSVKKLPCGHMFHANCLRGWLERGHNCPTCIAPVDREDYEKYLRDRNDPRQHQHQQQQPQPQQQQQEPAPAAAHDLVQQALIDQLQQQQEELLRSLTQQLEQEQQVPEVAVNQQQDANQDIQVLNNIMNSVMVQGDAFQGSDESTLVTRDMYIRYLENTRALIDETLEQLKK